MLYIRTGWGTRGCSVQFKLYCPVGAICCTGCAVNATTSSIGNLYCLTGPSDSFFGCGIMLFAPDDSVKLYCPGANCPSSCIAAVC